MLFCLGEHKHVSAPKCCRSIRLKQFSIAILLHTPKRTACLLVTVFQPSLELPPPPPPPPPHCLPTLVGVLVLVFSLPPQPAAIAPEGSSSPHSTGEPWFGSFQLPETEGGWGRKGRGRGGERRKENRLTLVTVCSYTTLFHKTWPKKL